MQVIALPYFVSHAFRYTKGKNNFMAPDISASHPV